MTRPNKRVAAITALTVAALFGIAIAAATYVAGPRPTRNRSTVLLPGQSLDGLVDMAEFICCEKDYRIQTLKYLLTPRTETKLTLLANAAQKRRLADCALAAYSNNIVAPEDCRNYQQLLKDWDAVVHMEPSVAIAGLPGHREGESAIVNGTINALFVKTRIDSEAMLDWNISVTRRYERGTVASSTAYRDGIIATLLVSALLSVVILQRYERARMDALIADREAILRSERRYQSILRNSSDVVMTVDASNLVEYTSPACYAQWGYAESVVKNAACQQFVHLEDVPIANALLSRAIGSPGESVSDELRILCAGGDYRHHEVIVNDLSRDDGVGGIVWTFRNIMERKTFEKRLTHQAYHDPLTGLPNRALFLHRLARALVLPH